MDYNEFSPEKRDYLMEGIASREACLCPCATHSSAELRQRYVNYGSYRADPDSYLIRQPFVMDVDKILNNPFFNRFTDKTQVFSLYRNDDVSYRSFHIQLVSRIARTLGNALRLNTDLIEAIALGHDMGHTPFGHEGEHILSGLYHERTGRYFNHNVHSVRVLKDICDLNLTLQTYDGILCHCGEAVSQEYRPHELGTFEELEAIIERCYADQSEVARLRPSTLEGCVVRVSDILAYVGKDRQDADRVLGVRDATDFPDNPLGSQNWEIIRSVTSNIVANSIGKDYLAMDKEVEVALKTLKTENDELIYRPSDNQGKREFFDEVVLPMMRHLYERFLDDINRDNRTSPLFTRHLLLPLIDRYYHRVAVSDDDKVVDCIAAMTDDYFIEIYRYLFPDDPLNDAVTYHPLFQE